MVDGQKPIAARQESAQHRLAALTRTSALTGLIGHGAELGSAWGNLSLSRQHAIVGALIDHVTIGPGKAGARGLDPARADVTWRH